MLGIQQRHNLGQDGALVFQRIRRDMLLMLCDCQFDLRMAREMKRGRREGGAGAEKNDEKNLNDPKFHYFSGPVSARWHRRSLGRELARVSSRQR